MVLEDEFLEMGVIQELVELLQVLIDQPWKL